MRLSPFHAARVALPTVARVLGFTAAPVAGLAAAATLANCDIGQRHLTEEEISAELHEGLASSYLVRCEGVESGAPY